MVLINTVVYSGLYLRISCCEPDFLPIPTYSYKYTLVSALHFKSNFQINTVE